MTQRVAILTMILLLDVSFSLATYLQPRSERMSAPGASGNVITMLLGDARRMFANHFFVQADVYFHSGYYPSFFQQSYQKTATEVHIAEHAHDQGPQVEEKVPEPGSDFLGQPRDWIDDFGRHFYSSKHSHLDKPGTAREILPWLRLSAELDPQQIQTYTVAAYWLRKNMNKSAEAEEFLREGLRANPTSVEILYELGNIYSEDRHDPIHASNLWEMGLQRWREQDNAGKKPDPLLCDELTANLAHLDEDQGNLPGALGFLEQQVKVSPAPDAVQKHIDELKQQIAQGKK